MTNEEYQAYMKSERWRRIAKKRFEIDNYTCQGCGSKGSANNELQIHHLSYRHLGAEENWIYEDLVCVCRCCHKNLHRILERQTNAAGRKGWRDSARIPQTHVFNISGDIEIIERKEQGK